MKYLKNIVLVISLIFIGVIMGWWGKYEYEKAECIRDHDNCYLLKKENSKQPVIKFDTNLDEVEDSSCEFIISTNPLIIQYAQNGYVNCDTAYTNLELNFCSGIKACLERKKMDSLNFLLLTIYDSLIKEQDDEVKYWIAQGDSSMIEYISDYKLIKKMHRQSIIKFVEYVDMEIAIVGIEIGTGRLRPSYENYRGIEILESKNRELEKLIGEYVE